MTDRKRSERTAYPRLLAPVYFTHAGPLSWWLQGRAVGEGLGGVSVFTDERPEKGARLNLEIFLVDGTSVTCGAAVAWVDPLPDGAPARYDVGLEFVAVRPGDRERLSAFLAPP